MATRRKRSSGIRGHGRIDAERVAEAVGRPGIDPRAWVATGRSDSSMEGRVFDSANGWLVDVVLPGTTVPCRVVAPWPGGDGYGRHQPPAGDEEVVVLFPGGDPDEDPIVLGVLANEDGGSPPTTVAGRAVLPEGVTVLGGPIAAPDCDFSKSPYARVQEHGGEWHLHAKWVTVTTDSPLAGIRWGSATASHPVARGDEVIAAFKTLIDALTQCFNAGTTGGGGPATMTGILKWQQAAEKLKLTIEASLVSRGVVVD